MPKDILQSLVLLIQNKNHTRMRLWDESTIVKRKPFSICKQLLIHSLEGMAT